MNVSSSTSSPPRITAASVPRPVVFLAEDDDELRRLLSDILRREGFEVRAAATGQEMLELVAAASRSEIAVPDAIVMDVRMPKCSGTNVLSVLRAAEWRQPIVIMTAFGDDHLRADAASRGASVVLDKPFDADDLVATLDILLLFSAHASEPDDDEPPTVRCPTFASQSPTARDPAGPRDTNGVCEVSFG